MRILIAGQKWLAAGTLGICLERGHEVVAVVVPDASDRLALTAAPWGIRAIVEGRKIGPDIIPDGTDLILAAHCHAFITSEARNRTRLGAIGYHPSLLPRHRGRDAIRWAIHMREPVTGGTVYWMDDKADAGPIAAQDWCHIRPDDTPEALWRRELGPMGLGLFRTVLSDLEKGIIRAEPQASELATWEPGFNRPNITR